MKKVMYYMAVSAIILFSGTLAGCSDDNEVSFVPDDVEDVIEGPSSSDVLVLPTGAAFLGDSIQQIKTFSLSDNKIKLVTVSTTQNGHISVLGGYKDQSAVYIYAKPDDDDNYRLSDEQIKNILEKYYVVESYVNDTEIVANIMEKDGIAHGADYHKLRISIKLFTPQNISTKLSIGRGSIIAKNVCGNQHTASSISGTIKYIDSFGKNFALTSETGYIGIINTPASQSIEARLAKGNILFSLPQSTKATLSLSSSSNVNAHILNSSNFKGTNIRTKVEGALNGGGYKISANSGLGVINLKWYQNNQND
ncbi:hypothetical protein M2451_004003 [Dysgonomonas sp. PFB1-18]|uniref:hypothetical protein n=1 Tax=unclassified Dysgonomonas TaxID=2630389 RepID=UPI0024736B83|nr:MULTISPECIES: hypothetical protein [unclassified Dysgonomonas]MDH6311128.1 hypothetical protein [Dysgonomonas sp. PF1-14]MDH6341018.1 hypothetical protein [Dysgonomonas sp. PF1-16]MDH6382658.1 hypothetical protein [Dysgonomonas sp. PFB1-18]MDH6399993.1 hypothetical protein [Dysgonomonas sp. PF1-23]